MNNELLCYRVGRYTIFIVDTMTDRDENLDCADLQLPDANDIEFIRLEFEGSKVFVTEHSLPKSVNGMTAKIFFGKNESDQYSDVVSILEVTIQNCNVYIRSGLCKIFENAGLYILSSMIATFSAPYRDVRYAIDRAEIKNQNIFVNGWIENAATLKIVIFSKDLLSYSSPDNFHFLHRPDVTELMRAANRPYMTSKHGFSATFKIMPDTGEIFSVFVEIDEQLEHIGDFTALPLNDADAAVKFYWSVHAGASIPPSSFVGSFIRPLLQASIYDPHYQRVTLFEASNTVDVSIIVPIYGEWFFLRSLFIMQKFFPPNYEWIFICDDPTIALEISNYLASRSNSFERTTVFIFNEMNYGYSASNNIGVKESKGKVLLFMNSDIWVTDSSSIVEAANMIISKRLSIIGFRLLFEDGSLQHDGLAFVRSPQFQNLYLAEHLRKGLPAPPAKNGVISCTAVTGALMMVGRAPFERCGGFDRIFIKGDFEDADLCLRMSVAGGGIGLIQTGNHFHLERQSIRTMASTDFRQAITLANCITFNERWGALLDAL